jgi:hypothetical protein
MRFFCAILLLGASICISQPVSDLEDLQNRFRTQALRRQNPTEYVTSMDRVIAPSPYQYLLKCREDWVSNAGATFRFKFSQPGVDEVMTVDPRPSGDGTKHPLVMHFSLSDSVQRVFFAYIHEMVHICQFNSDLRNGKDPQDGTQDADGQWARDFLFGEIEAHYTALRAYQFFSKISPRLATDELDAEILIPSLGEAFEETGKDLLEGRFAQRVISWHRTYGPFQPHPEDIYDMSSDVLKYPAWALGSGFEMHHLRPELAARIRGLGIPLVEK